VQIALTWPQYVDINCFVKSSLSACVAAASPAHRYSEFARRGLHGGCDPEIVLSLPADLAATQRDQIDGVAGEMPRAHGPAGAARDQLDLPLTRAQDLPGPRSPEL
jgi:hypothetical protein